MTVKLVDNVKIRDEGTVAVEFAVVLRWTGGLSAEQLRADVILHVAEVTVAAQADRLGRYMEGSDSLRVRSANGSLCRRVLLSQEFVA